VEREKTKRAVLESVWSWPVVGSVLFFIYGGGLTFTTSGHPALADVFYVVGSSLFVAKFLTWEETKHQAGRNRTVAVTGIVAMSMLTGFSVWGNHKLNPGAVKPDLAFIIVNPEAPGLILWPLRAVAPSVKADPLLWDIDRDDKGSDSLLINEAKYDWIRPDQHGGPTSLLHPNDVQNVVKPGHRIIGYITMACPDCERARICWVYFVYGQKGWFMDTSSHGGPNPAKIAESIPALRAGDPEQFLASFPEWASRIEILPKP